MGNLTIPDSSGEDSHRGLAALRNAHATGAEPLAPAGPSRNATSPDTPEPLEVSPTGGLRILLVEDNVINRTFATRVLSRRGHTLTHAANGCEAVAAAARETFDLILMDVQMPEMDGLEATRRIRAHEHDRGQHTQIVALTAHAMAGDRERCLSVGMDDYLSKPLQKEMLLELLDRLPRRAVPPDLVAECHVTDGEVPAPDTPLPQDSCARDPAAPIFSREQLLDELDGDEALLRRIIALFFESTPRLLADLRTAIARHDASEVARTAHALISPLGAFGATDASALARRLEGFGERGDLTEADAASAKLHGEVARVTAALDELTRAAA